MNCEEEGSFGDLLAAYRTQKRKSQEGLANCLGVHRSTIVKWELKGNLPKDRTRVEEIVRCLQLADDQRDALLRAALLDTSQIIWNVPYPRNRYFTGSQDVLAQLTTILQSEGQVALSQPQAISGLGGVGKTQIAVEYAHHFSQQYQAVLWALANTTEALVSGYVAIAKLLNLPEKNEQDQTITVQAVIRWLITHTRWLLILDNADDLTVIRDFLPSKLRGHILLTTRAHAMGGLANHIEVNPMKQGVAMLFLLRRASLIALDTPLEQVTPSDIAIAREISEELGGLPLALDQAGAYIEETQCSLSQYLQNYRTRRAILLKRRGRVVTDHPDSVVATWSLSFEQVEQQSPAAADLLRLCAYLSPDAIPEELITKGAAHLGPHLSPIGEDPLALDEIIAALGAYSLIRRDARESTLSIHRLVQAILRDAMDTSSQQCWAERAVNVVDATLPPVEHANWSQWERMLAQARACAGWIEQLGIRLPEAAEVLSQTGWYLTDRGRYREAQPLLERAYQISREERGTEHLDTARDASVLACLYWSQGKYAEAEPLHQHALSIREQQLGPTHSDTANSLSNLASLYADQGKYTEAEPLYQRALAIREQQLGPTHSDTANSLNNLASLYEEQGKYEEAEPLYRRALSICEQQLGPTHPGTATSLNNLAKLYQAQGKYAEAEPLYIRALAIFEQLGPTHPGTATSLNNLALLYEEQGKYEEAEPLLKWALAIREQQLGPQHPDTARNLNNLALLYKRQGKYEEAEPLYQRALSIKKQQLGPTHPGTATSLNNLAGLYQAQGKYEQAEPLYQRALAIREQQLGPTHPDTATSLNDLAKLYQAQGKYEEAEPLYQRALSICEQQLGPTHPNVAQSLNNLAGLYQAQGKYQEAEPLCIRALAIFQ